MNTDKIKVYIAVAALIALPFTGWAIKDTLHDIETAKDRSIENKVLIAQVDERQRALEKLQKQQADFNKVLLDIYKEQKVDYSREAPARRSVEVLRGPSIEQPRLEEKENEQ